MNSLTYRQKARKNINHTNDSVIYIHHFGTGWQELVFVSHESAVRWAVKTGCEYHGPVTVVC